MKSCYFIQKVLFIVLILSIISACKSPKRDWEKTEKEMTVEAFKKYIEMYPNSEYLVLAKQKLDSLQWNEAKLKNSIELFEIYLKDNPGGRYLGEANQKLATLEWEIAKKNNNIDVYKKYLAKYPNINYSDSVKTNIFLLECTWNDGFLERDYNFNEQKIHDAFMDIFNSQMMAISYGDVKGGVVHTYGIFDNKGLWEAKTGNRVSIKYVKKQDCTNVGLKINQGNKESAVRLHQLLIQKLKKIK